MPRVLFLFNHDAAHQVAHLAPVAAALAREKESIETIIAYASHGIRQRIETIIGPDDAQKVTWKELELGPVLRRSCALLDRILPASRLARLRVYQSYFADCDAVISTERTCLRVQARLPENRRPLFVRVPHGTGDRSVTFHPDHRRFDMSLVAGAKMADQLIENGVQKERIVITGYSKFETIDLTRKPRIFDNDRPTLVYNPHFDPHLSSWYDAGPDVLSWFASADGQAFNCIFAPHVMLFRKATHVSPEYKVARRRPDIPAEALAADNILIEIDGPKLFDMTYMLGADGYIGDASSQIYEFMARPRPTILLDPHDYLSQEGSEQLPFLTTGQVVRDTASLKNALGQMNELQKIYEPIQRALIDRTFSLSETPPSTRAAEAIAQLLGAPTE